MAVTSKSLRSTQRIHSRVGGMPSRLYALAYGVTLVLAAFAIYALVGLAVSRAQIALDDIHYGRPRTMHLDAFVGHAETAGVPTHLMAINLNRQVMIVELPGGDPAQTRVLNGPYLFGADADLTPVSISLRDVNADGQPDLLLDVRRELIIYVNKDGVFRLPTPDEQALLNRGGGR